MFLLAVTLSQIGQSALVGVALLLAFGQLLFPSEARSVYIGLKGLRGIVVSPASPALSNYVLRFFALGAILSLLCIEAAILRG